MIAFTIPGTPQGKARARTCRNGHSYTQENTVLYENLVKTEFLRQCGREQRIRAEQNRPAFGDGGCGHVFGAVQLFQAKDGFRSG